MLESRDIICYCYYYNSQHQKEKYKNNNVCPDLSKSVLANISETDNNIQSDSDEDFPGSNSDSEDDAEFYDAIDNNNNKKPVKILKFGRDSVVNKSTYGYVDTFTILFI